MTDSPNVDVKTVQGFGEEWSKFTQAGLSDAERAEVFRQYFSLIDWTLVAADASREALKVAQSNVSAPNVSFVEATPDSLPFPDGHFDLIFSLGVLHHVPDTEGAIRSLAPKLAPGGTLLLYLYYAFDNRPAWFRAVWKVSDLARRIISGLPFSMRYVISQLIAVCVYWPLARAARYLPVPASWPLRYYANRSFYFMRTDALDRFGTKLEKRFTRKQIEAMLESAGFSNIRFSDSMPYWVCAATGKHQPGKECHHYA